MVSEDVLEQFGKVLGYSVFIEEQVHVGAVYAITLKADKISALDLLLIIEAHLTPARRLHLDIKSKSIRFVNQ
jgi:hypothetical protein